MTHIILFVCIFLSFLSTCFPMLSCPRPNCSRRVLFNRNNKGKRVLFRSKRDWASQNGLPVLNVVTDMQTNLYVLCINTREIHSIQERPFHDDSTASRLLSEVKHRRAWLVLRWGTTLESRVLFFCFFSSTRPRFWPSL